MANRRFIDFPIATTVGDSDIILIWQTGVNKQTTKATFLSGLPENLDELNDVAISGLTNGQILRYDSVTGKWENTDQGNLDLNDLNDVSIVSPSNGQVLVYNSSTSKWENSSGGFVPYVGAVTTVDLGAQGLRAGYVRFDTSVASVPDEQGLVYWDQSRSTAALIMNGVLQHIGQDVFYYVKNSTGSSIAKGTAVRFNGTDGASGHLLIAPFLANGTYPSNYFMGVTAETIANGAFGQVMHFGELDGINTSGYTAGALLYASTTTAGGFQTTAPVAPNNIVLIAAAINSKNNGTILVRPTYGSNINQDEGVKITSPTTGDLLQLQAGGLWENKTKAQILGGTSSQFVKGDGSLDSTSYLPLTGGTLTGGLNGTSAAFTGNVSSTTGVFSDVAFYAKHSGSTSTIIGHNGIQGDADGFVVANSTKGFRINFPNNNSYTHTLPNASGTIALTSQIPANPVGGTGTTNYLSKFTGTSTIGNSQIFDNGTNVGIGTASPLSLLHIQSNSSGQTISNVTNLLLENNGSANDFFVFQTATAGGGKSFSITNAGNIGIKTTTPQGVLDVVGVSYFTRGTKWIVVNPNYGGADTHAQLQASSGMALRFATNGDNDRMTLTSGGNLLVGTTTDNGARLQVAGSASFTGNVLMGFNNALRVGDSPYRFSIYRSSAGNLITYFDDEYDVSNSSIRFRMRTSGTPIEALTITSGGNVGIGTTAPTDFGGTFKSLDVQGSTGGYVLATNSGASTIAQMGVGSGIAYYGLRTSGDVAFTTANTERMRITSGGNVLIGTTTDGGNGVLQVNKSASNAVVRFINARNTSGDFCLVTELGSNCNNTSSYHYIAATGGADKFYVYGNGTYATVSDARLKKNIESVTEKFLDKILNLDIVNYHWNDQQDSNPKQIGLIAQDVESQFPFLVNENRPDAKGDIYKNINVSSLPYVIIKAIQELKQEIDTLKN